MARIIPTQPLLIMLYGYPGAGKTYFARQLSDQLQAVHIHGDRIRAELFKEPRYDEEEDQIVAHIMDYMTSEFLRTGTSVLYDTNAARSSERRILRDIANTAHVEPILVWLQVDATTAFKRTQKRDKRRQEDKYSAPLTQAAFEQIAAHMQNPSEKEPYVVISGKHLFKTQGAAFIRRMQELGLVETAPSPNSRVVKPGLVNLIPKAYAGRVDMARRNINIR